MLWSAIARLKEIEQHRSPEEVRKRLANIASAYRAEIVRLDEREDLVAAQLAMLSEAIADVEVVRESLGDLGGTANQKTLRYLAALSQLDDNSAKSMHRRLDRSLREVQQALALLAKAMRLATGVTSNRPKHRPRLPYLGAASAFALLWEEISGKLPTTHQSTIKVKGSKTKRANTTSSGKFMFAALRMVNPNIKSSEARTSTRSAVRTIKRRRSMSGPDAVLARKLLEHERPPTDWRSTSQARNK
jgi:hypothetical protein